jgi:hypothetical protein
MNYPLSVLRLGNIYSKPRSRTKMLLITYMYLNNFLLEIFKTFSCYCLYFEVILSFITIKVALLVYPVCALITDSCSILYSSSPFLLLLSINHGQILVYRSAHWFLCTEIERWKENHLYIVDMSCSKSTTMYMCNVCKGSRLDNDSVLARIFFKEGVFNPCNCMKKKNVFSKDLNCYKNWIFLWNYVLFGLNKMCKAHFHPFAVIISPFHAMGVKIYIKKIIIFFLKGAPSPPGHFS